ncbi:MAG: glycosyltransferase family 4 protein [Candidatus Bathyarchaeia archaeon]
MIRIGVFSENFWPDGGGAELATYLFLKLLAVNKEFEIKVFTGTKNAARIPQIQITFADFLSAPNKLKLFWNIHRNKNLVKRLVRKYDIVYIPSHCYPIVPIAKKFNKNVVVHLHDYQPVSFSATMFAWEDKVLMNDSKRTFMREYADEGLIRAFISTVFSPMFHIVRKWVGLADNLICVSKRQEKLLLKLAPEYKCKTVVIYNPPPEIPQFPKSLSKPPVLLYSGGDSFVKGFHVFLEASQKLLRQGEKVRFILAGKYKPQYLALTERLIRKYNNAYLIVGKLGYCDLIKLHKKVWGVVFPSICEEPFPYVILESMLCGTIPIASKVGGIPEIFDGELSNDFLFDPLKVDELVKKMSTLTSMDIRKVNELGLTISKEVREKFNAKTTVERITKIFTQSICN